MIFDRFGVWALEYSKIVGENVCDHFLRFDWPIDSATIAECQELETMDDVLEPYLGECSTA